MEGGGEGRGNGSSGADVFTQEHSEHLLVMYLPRNSKKHISELSTGGHHRWVKHSQELRLINIIVMESRSFFLYTTHFHTVVFFFLSDTYYYFFVLFFLFFFALHT